MKYLKQIEKKVNNYAREWGGVEDEIEEATEEVKEALGQIGQITKEEIEYQSIDYNDSYLSGVSDGDFVWCDTEVCAGIECIEVWVSTTEGREQLIYELLLLELQSLNAKG